MQLSTKRQARDSGQTGRNCRSARTTFFQQSRVVFLRLLPRTRGHGVLGNDAVWAPRVLSSVLPSSSVNELCCALVVQTGLSFWFQISFCFPICSNLPVRWSRFPKSSHFQTQAETARNVAETLLFLLCLYYSLRLVGVMQNARGTSRALPAFKERLHLSIGSSSRAGL